MQSHPELHLRVSKGKGKRCIFQAIITCYKFHNGILQPLEIFLFSDSSDSWVVHMCKFAAWYPIFFFFFVKLSFLLCHLSIQKLLLKMSLILYLCCRKIHFVRNFNYLGSLLGDKGDFKVVEPVYPKIEFQFEYKVLYFYMKNMASENLLLNPELGRQGCRV